MYVLKWSQADLYYKCNDMRSGLPIYTKEIKQARQFSTKRAAKNHMRHGDMIVKYDGKGEM